MIKADMGPLAHVGWQLGYWEQEDGEVNKYWTY